MHRLLRPPCPILAGALLAVSVSGCQVAGDVPTNAATPSASAATSETLRNFAPPPSAPPEVTVGTVEVPVLNADWRSASSAEASVTVPEDSLTVDDLPVTERDGDIKTQIETSVWPGELGLTLFEEVGPDRVPVGTGTDVDCSTGALCAISQGEEGTLGLELNIGDDVQVGILHVYYPIELGGEDDGHGDVGLNYASYGFRVAGS